MEAVNRFKKYLVECFGTFVLVLFGCGAAVFLKDGNHVNGIGVLGVAMAFGLSIVALAYVIGNISGCHVNPAVSFAMFIDGQLDVIDFAGYIISQIIGAIAGAGVLALILDSATFFRLTNPGLGQNGFGSSVGIGISMWAALVVEFILTFVFVFAILGVTSSKKYKCVSGIVIGLTLAFVHILGINLTGTSVNPARSIGPAIFVGGAALTQLWVFIVAPLLGGAAAAFVWKFIRLSKVPNKEAVLELDFEVEEEPNFEVDSFVSISEPNATSEVEDETDTTERKEPTL